MRARVSLPRLFSAEGFPRAARAYWLGVFPLVRAELRCLHARAAAIESPRLRAIAFAGLAKRGNMEGAAAFATFVPCSRRPAVVRATVAFQAAYNHLDALSEQPGRDEAERARRSHDALLAALDSATSWEQSVESCAGDSYLLALVHACRGALAELPSYPTAAGSARRAAERVVAFQRLNRSYGDGDHGALRRWSERHTAVADDLCWWETAAAAGSSLGVHALLAASASPSLNVSNVDALKRAYFPWIGALHSLLDQLIDRDEDARMGQRNLVECYPSPTSAAERMGRLARRSLACAAELSPRGRHELIVAAMASFYLSTPAARSTHALPVTREVLRVLGPAARPTMAVFALRRAIERGAPALERPDLRHRHRAGRASPGFGLSPRAGS